MTIQELTTQVQAHTGEWRSLRERAGNLQARLTALSAKRDEIVAAAQQCQADISARLQALGPMLPEQVDSMQQTLADLAGLPEALSAAATATEMIATDSLTRLASAAKEAETALGEEMEKAGEETTEAVRAEFDNLKQFVEEDFVESLKEGYVEQVEAVCETCEELRESVEERIDELVEHAQKQVEALTEKLDEFGDQWTSSVEEVKDAYGNLVERIVTLGKDVTTLTESIDLALQTTGIGMNAATQSMDDIRSVMEDVV